MRLLMLVLICLTGMISTSCKDFPEVSPYKLVISKDVCGEYTQVSKNPPQFKFVKYWPLSHCEGFFAISPQETANIQAWCKSNPGECN